MVTITLSNQKGGVAKTTTVFAMASGLAHRGFRVLAVDLDPQTNLSFSSGVDILNLKRTLFDVFRGAAEVGEVMIHSSMGFDLLPGGLDLAGADMDFTQTGREQMLKELLDQLHEGYDFCVIDTPPTLGILTVNALTASDYQIIPMAADAYSLQGLGNMRKLISRVQRYCNRDLKVMGLLLTKYSERHTVSKTVSEVINQTVAGLGTMVFETRIRESVAVKDVCLHQGDLFDEIPNANAVVDYNSFIDEMLGVLGYGNEKDK